MIGHNINKINRLFKKMKLLQTFIAEHLVYTPIYEMAVSLYKFNAKIEYMSKPIIAHILLILKSEKENNYKYVSYWKSEIKNYLLQFFDTKLKVKDNYNKRIKYIKNILINELELDTKVNLGFYCYSKLFKEGYDMDNGKTAKEFEQLTIEFQTKYLDNMMDCMADHNINKINEFIKSL